MGTPRTVRSTSSNSPPGAASSRTSRARCSITSSTEDCIVINPPSPLPLRCLPRRMFTAGSFHAASRARAGARSGVAEQVPGDLAHLDLLRPLGDAVPAVVAIDVFERGVPGVAESTVDLEAPLRGVADHTVRPVVAHRHPVADRQMVDPPDLPRRPAHEG